MKIRIISLLFLLCWVSAMAEKSVSLCARCTLPLNSQEEKLVRVGCVENHILHSTCMRALDKDYDKRSEKHFCPIASCAGFGNVDKHEIYEIEEDQERQLFRPYAGFRGKLRLIRDFFRETWHASNEPDSD